MKAFETEFIVLEGKESQFRDFCLDKIKFCNQEKDCIGAGLRQDIKNKNRFVMYEMYKNEAAYTFHVNQDYFKTWKEQTAPIIVESEIKDWGNISPAEA